MTQPPQPAGLAVSAQKRVHCGPLLYLAKILLEDRDIPWRSRHKRHWTARGTKWQNRQVIHPGIVHVNTAFLPLTKSTRATHDKIAVQQSCPQGLQIGPSCISPLPLPERLKNQQLTKPAGGSSRSRAGATCTVPSRSTLRGSESIALDNVAARDCINGTVLGHVGSRLPIRMYSRVGAT